MPAANDLDRLAADAAGPGELAAKAIGELTNTLVTPAIANAMADAIGVRITDLPISAERILAGLFARATGNVL